jgi:hypothetical protein
MLPARCVERVAVVLRCDSSISTRRAQRYWASLLRSCTIRLTRGALRISQVVDELLAFVLRPRLRGANLAINLPHGAAPQQGQHKVPITPVSQYKVSGYRHGGGL